MVSAAGRPTNPFEPFGRAAIEQSIPERFESRVRRHPDRRQGPALVAAILGALKAGKVYVPLEATWPAVYLRGLGRSR